jgi:hypothetical protein
MRVSLATQLGVRRFIPFADIDRARNWSANKRATLRGEVTIVFDAAKSAADPDSDIYRCVPLAEKLVR